MMDWLLNMGSQASAAGCGISASSGASLPAPLLDPRPADTDPQTVVLGGGCFWGIQAVFQHLKGVSEAVSGYAGGDPKRANYNAICSGTSGHAEVVKVTYDPAQVSLGQILQVYFSVAHDPTQLDRQGPDRGTQYRSEIFCTAPEQETTARAYIEQLQKSGTFIKPIVTKVGQLSAFYLAEDEHQNYVALHPHAPYVAIHDLPKVADLKKLFPDLYVKK